MSKAKKPTPIRRFPVNGGRNGFMLTEQQWITIKQWALRRESPPCAEELHSELLYQPGKLIDMAARIALTWGVNDTVDAAIDWSEKNVHLFALMAEERKRIYGQYR